MRSSGQFPSQKIVEKVRKEYPAGCRVELVSIKDTYTALKPGERGRVNMVDDTGTIFVDWDSGSGLGIIYGIDQIRKI